MEQRRGSTGSGLYGPHALLHGGRGVSVSGSEGEMRRGAADPAEEQSPALQRVWRLVRWFRGPSSVEQSVTRMMLPAGPELCWKAVAFYEEIPLRAPWLLRTLLPVPVRAVGAKSKAGAMVDCIYAGGRLTKRITAIDAPRSIEFEVLDERLGIEDCVSALNGSYVIRPVKAGSEITLTTRYRTNLQPRWVFRPLEHMVLHALHRHVLRGLVVLLRHRSEATAAPGAAKNEEQHAYAGDSVSPTAASPR